MSIPEEKSREAGMIEGATESALFEAENNPQTLKFTISRAVASGVAIGKFLEAQAEREAVVAPAEPADFLEEALYSFKPGMVSAEDLAWSAANRAAETSPEAGRHLVTVAQDLIDNDPRILTGEQ